MVKRAGLFTRAEVGRKRSTNSTKKQSLKDLPVARLHEIREAGVERMNTEALNPCMPATGSDKPLLYVLGEAPGRNEDEQGRQFVGKAGKELRSAIPDKIGDRVRWNNVCRTRPPGNRNPTQSEIECFRPSVIEDIEATKPKAILAVGAIAAQWCCQSASPITKVRGMKFAVKVGSHSCWAVPTIHPAYVLRQLNDRRAKPPGEELRRALERDVLAASSLVKAGSPCIVEPSKAQEAVVTATRPRPIIDALESLADMPVLFGDLETNRLRPYSDGANVLTAAFGDDEQAVAFPIDHSGVSFTRKDRRKIIDAVDWLLRNAKSSAWHNLGFDLEWLVWLLGKDIARCTEWHCTQAGSYVLGHPIGTQSLDFLVQKTCGVGLKEQSNIDRGKLESAPLDKVLSYNALDVIYLAHVFDAQQDEIEREELDDVYADQVDRVPTVVLAQAAGMPVSVKAVTNLKREDENKLEALQEKLKADKWVQRYSKRFGRFNPSAPDQVAKLLRDVMDRDEGVRGDKYSTDEKVLKQIDLPVTRTILAIRQTEKNLSTYINRLMPDAPDTYVYPDGMVHTSFNTTFTTTRRLSSEEPNAQNYPKRDPERKKIRRAYRAPKGYKILAADHGQIEARAIAWASEDEALIDALWKNYDIHMAWAERIVELDDSVLEKYEGKYEGDDKIMKAFRTDVKNQLVFPAFYGAKESYLAQLLGIDDGTSSKLFNEFWDQFADVKAWQKRLLKFYNKHFYVETLTGFRRYGPLTQNEVINSPIQGTASDVVVDGWNRLSVRAVVEDKPWLQGRWNIHDDLTFVVPETKVEEATHDIVTEMLSCEFDFISTPLSVEVEVGKSWYAMEEVGTFQSHEYLKAA